MAYIGRDWDNTGTKVTKEDFKRMETGIKNNDNQINVLNNRTLAPALSNVIPDALYIGDEWTGICCVRTDYGTVNAPPNCLIGVRTMKKLNSDNVIVYVDNTQNGESWKNTWNGTEWEGWQQIATAEEIPITFQNGWELESGVAKAIRVGKTITFCFTAKSGVGGGATIFSLPYEAVSRNFIINAQDTDWNITQANISTQGNEVKYWGNANGRVEIPQIAIS